MKNQITLAVALAFVCSTFAFAQADNTSLRSNIERQVYSRYETPSQVRERVLNEVKDKNAYAYQYLKAKNDLINHYHAGKMSEQEIKAVEAYKCGQINEAYEILGFNLYEVVKATEELHLYQPSFTLQVFKWPVQPTAKDDNAYLAVNRAASARQTTLQVVREKVNELAEGSPKRALREYALEYYNAMDGLLNRYAIAQSTDQDQQALKLHRQGNLREAYEVLGFQLDKVAKAQESLDFYEMSMHPTFFAWPEAIQWNNK